MMYCEKECAMLVSKCEVLAEKLISLGAVDADYVKGILDSVYKLKCDKCAAGLHIQYWHLFTLLRYYLHSPK